MTTIHRVCLRARAPVSNVEPGLFELPPHSERKKSRSRRTRESSAFVLLTVESLSPCANTLVNHGTHRNHGSQTYLNRELSEGSERLTRDCSYPVVRPFRAIRGSSIPFPCLPWVTPSSGCRSAALGNLKSHDFSYSVRPVASLRRVWWNESVIPSELRSYPCCAAETYAGLCSRRSVCH